MAEYDTLPIPITELPEATTSEGVYMVGVSGAGLTQRVPARLFAPESSYLTPLAAELSAGFDFADNSVYSAVGVVTEIVATTATGNGVISFVAGASVSITLPSDSSWDGGVTPTFFEGRIYTVTYTEFRTWYADSGH